MEKLKTIWRPLQQSDCFCQLRGNWQTQVKQRYGQREYVHLTNLLSWVNQLACQSFSTNCKPGWIYQHRMGFSANLTWGPRDNLRFSSNVCKTLQQKECWISTPPSLMLHRFQQGALTWFWIFLKSLTLIWRDSTPCEKACEKAMPV